MLGLGRGWEEMELGLGSTARAMMHSTMNWSQQENWLEPGLCTGWSQWEVLPPCVSPVVFLCLSALAEQL